MKCDIILAGVGGQGILSIAATIGLAAVEQNLFLKQDLIEDLGQAFDIAYEHYLNRHAGESLFTFAQHVYA